MTNSISEATLNGWAAPKRIWLHDLGCGEVTWCEDRDPDGEQIEAVEYLRADTITPPLDSEAVEAMCEAREALNDCRDGMHQGADHERAIAAIARLDRALLSLAKPIRTGRLPTSADVGVAKPVGGIDRELVAEILWTDMRERLGRLPQPLPKERKDFRERADIVLAALTAMKEDDRGEGMVDE